MICSNNSIQYVDLHYVENWELTLPGLRYTDIIFVKDAESMKNNQTYKHKPFYVKNSTLGSLLTYTSEA